MISSVLAATDFSSRSDRAVRRAAMLARASGAALSLVHVVDSDQPRALIDAQSAASRALLEEAAAAINGMEGVVSRAIVDCGDVFSGILHAADQADAGLVVMGAHRRQLRDIFVGTTVERTIVHSRRPILMAAGEPSASWQRVLIALDMDDASEAAARRIRDLDILDCDRLVAMHAFDAPSRGLMARSPTQPGDIHRHVADEERDADGKFAAFLDRVGLGGVDRLLVPVNGAAARTILEAADAESADLVVVGTSQRRGIQRFLVGSVAEDVLADAQCDVLVIPRG